MATDIILGIDLGTTNSLVALGDRVFKDGESALIPSVIFFDEDGRIHSVGQRAKALKALEPRRTAYSVKRLMGRGKQDLAHIAGDLPFNFSESTDEMIRLKFGKFSYTPVELSAEILKRCKFVAENALGQPVRKAVITVPAYFNDAQRMATNLAGRLAGLEVVRILNEPTAAALAFGLGRDSASTHIAVYDFGGGTFDISVLKVTDGIFEVLSTHGDTQLGGDDIDEAFMRALVERMRKSPSDDEAWVTLKSQVERIKVALSDQEAVDVQIVWSGEVQWSGAVTRDDLEKSARPVVDRTIAACDEAMKASNISVSSLDHVVMVGGSSRMPYVRERVGEFFKKAPNTSVDPDEVVARGAAIQASILAGERKDTLLLDVVPLSLGLETMGGLVSKIIPRNTTIPAAASEMFTTYADNQTGIDLHIVQGERELARDCRSLGKFKLRIPPAPAGIPKVQVKFLMDANGILKVRAEDTKTKAEAFLELKPSFGLTDQEVEKMLQDAWDHAQFDFAQRQLIEATNQAESLILATEKSLKNPLLDSTFVREQKLRIEPVIRALRQDLQAKTAEVIALRTKELDHVTKDLAASILDRSISARLSQQNIEKIVLEA